MSERDTTELLQESVVTGAKGTSNLSGTLLTGQPQFGEKYKVTDFATFYFGKHESNLIRRISTWRERQIMAKALRLLQPFDSVLDLPSGAGRFLPAINKFGVRMFASDISAEMLKAGRRFDPRLHMEPMRFATSVLQPCLAEKSVDVILCARLIHHFADSEKRIAILSRLAKVVRKGIVLSFFDADTYKQKRRAQRQSCEGKVGNRHALTHEQMAAEAAEAGLDLLGMFGLFFNYAEITSAAFRLKS